MTAAPPRYFSLETAPNYLQSQVLYERKAVTDVWNKLTSVAKRQWKWMNVQNKRDRQWINADRRILQVHGPPGSGKSSAVFFWVEKTCKTANTHALWLKCAKAQGKCWKVQKNCLSETIGTIEQREVPLSVDDFADASIVVFDGIRAITLETFGNLIIDVARSGRFVVVVSSEGVEFHAGDSQDIMKLQHFVPSWQENEYMEACENNDFWASVKHRFLDATSESDTQSLRKELIRQKFSIAGHSARFMFRQTAVDVENEIERKVRQMENIATLNMAVRNDRSSGAVNSLIARLHRGKNGPTPPQSAPFPSEQDRNGIATRVEDLLQCHEDLDQRGSYPRLVSEKATEEIVKSIPGPVPTLRTIGIKLDNRAIIGYAFEKNLKSKLMEANLSNRGLRLFYENLESFQLPVSRLLEIQPEETSSFDALNELLKNRAKYEDNTWIFIGGRHCAFDAIHLAAKNRIRFVQVTVEHKCSFKLSIVDSLMRNLLAGEGNPVTWSHMEFLIIRPDDDMRPFALETASGELSGKYLHFDGQPWDTKDYRSNVKNARLGWY